MAAEHHEKYDVTGYPFQLKGEKISLYARVCVIMDVFGALTSPRTNRPSMTPFSALTEMKNNMEGHFDMRILVNFIKILADTAAAKVSASRSSGGSQSPNKQAAASTSFWRAQIKFFQSSGVHAHSVFLSFFSFHPNDLYFTLPAE